MGEVAGGLPEPSGQQAAGEVEAGPVGQGVGDVAEQRGRPLAAARAEAASSATSRTVCSMGSRSRPRTVRAREPRSSRRRLRTSPSHSACGTDAGLGAASKGFNLPGSPGPSAMDVPPKAAATALHSPLGSHGTYTR